MQAATIITTTTEPASRRLPWARIRRVSSITGAVVLALWFAVLADDILYRRFGGAYGIGRLSGGAFGVVFSLCPLAALLACLPDTAALHRSRQRLAFWPGLLVTMVAAFLLAAVCDGAALGVSVGLDAGTWHMPLVMVLLGLVMLAGVALPFEVMFGIVPVLLGYIGLRAVGRHVLGSLAGRILYGLAIGALAGLLFVMGVFGSMRFWAPWPEAALAGVALMLAFRPRWAGLP